jgi:hypothetical protein
MTGGEVYPLSFYLLFSFRKREGVWKTKEKRA